MNLEKAKKILNKEKEYSDSQIELIIEFIDNILLTIIRS